MYINHSFRTLTILLGTIGATSRQLHREDFAAGRGRAHNKCTRVASGLMLLPALVPVTWPLLIVSVRELTPCVRHPTELSMCILSLDLHYHFKT